MQSLIERVEGLKAPDREVDAEIHRLVFLPENPTGSLTPKKYTSRLDAAVQIMPREVTWPWHFTVSQSWQGCSALVTPNHADSYGFSDPNSGSGFGVNPAIALCGAALKARATLATIKRSKP